MSAVTGVVGVTGPVVGTRMVSNICAKQATASAAFQVSVKYTLARHVVINGLKKSGENIICLK